MILEIFEVEMLIETIQLSAFPHIFFEFLLHFLFTFKSILDQDDAYQKEIHAFMG